MDGSGTEDGHHSSRRPAGRLDDWTAELEGVLGVPGAPVDISLLLDVARDVAHAIDRPAVPITMFLLGYAAAERGGTVQGAQEACTQAEELARSWARAAQDETR